MRVHHILSVALLVSLTASFQVQAEAVSLDSLLKQVKSGRINDANENAERLKDFKSNKALQSKKLADMKAERKRQESRSVKLEKEFEANEKNLVVLEKALRERLGNLKELFGVLQQAAGDARGQFDNSLTQIQFAGRSDYLTDLAQKMGSPVSSLPSKKSNVCGLNCSVR